MAATSNIEWTEATLNPWTGCTKVDPACAHCYIDSTPPFRIAGRKFERGHIPLVFHMERLEAMVRRRKPTLYFVNSLSDLFHEDAGDDQIAQVFAAMALAPQHTFQCLTKRAERMRDLLTDPEFPHAVARAMDAMAVDRDHIAKETWRCLPSFAGYAASSHGRVRGPEGLLATHINPRTGREAVTLWNRGEPKTMLVQTLVLLAHVSEKPDGLEACHRNGDKRDNRLANLRWGTRSENQREKVRHGARGGPSKLTAQEAAAIRALRAQGLTQQVIADRFGVSRSLVSLIESGEVWGLPIEWPLPNVWLGVTIGNRRFVGRADVLRATPAAVRFISAEPLLGPLIGFPCPACRGSERVDDPELVALYESGDPDTEDPGDKIKRWQCWQPCPSCHDPVVGPTGKASLDLTGIDWLIVGGESGPKHRPFNPQHARDLRDACAASGTAFFMKQYGGVRPGTALEDLPEDLRIREYPRARP